MSESEGGAVEDIHHIAESPMARPKASLDLSSILTNLQN